MCVNWRVFVTRLHAYPWTVKLDYNCLLQYSVPSFLTFSYCLRIVRTLLSSVSEGKVTGRNKIENRVIKDSILTCTAMSIGQV